MALNEKQQAFEAINRAKSILIVSCEHPTPDTIASVSACLQYLTKEGKRICAVIPGFDEAKSPSFLPNTKKIQSDIGGLRSLRISLDISQTPLEEFSYDVRENKLEITIIPKKGE